jgi:hypothetical protein
MVLRGCGAFFLFILLTFGSVDSFGLESVRSIEGNSKELVNELEVFLTKFGVQKGTMYAMQSEDLNEDGSNELIVWLTGSDWCGTGGCTTLILDRQSNGWRILAKLPTTRTPIIALKSKSDGWADLSVVQSGGGNLKPQNIKVSVKNGEYVKTGVVIESASLNDKILIDNQPRLFTIQNKEQMGASQVSRQ